MHSLRFAGQIYELLVETRHAVPNDANLEESMVCHVPINRNRKTGTSKIHIIPPVITGIRKDFDLSDTGRFYLNARGRFEKCILVDCYFRFPGNNGDNARKSSTTAVTFSRI